MPTPKRIRADAARLGIQTIRTVVDGRTVQVARSVCTACEGHDEIRQPAGTATEAIQAAFEAKGWTGFGQRVLCQLRSIRGLNACSRSATRRNRAFSPIKMALFPCHIMASTQASTFRSFQPSAIGERN